MFSRIRSLNENKTFQIIKRNFVLMKDLLKNI